MTREEAIIYLKRADVTVGREPKTKTAEALEMAIKALEQEPRWIPVGERLPDIHNYSEFYLVTLSNGEVTMVMFTETNGKSWWERTRYKIIAWMPLPQAYREVEE